MLSFLYKKDKKNHFPCLWVMNPELYPQVVLNFRKIKNTIIHYGKKNKKIFLLTGTERETGVSSVAFNLSLICAWDMPDHRILLIDANTSSPALHNSFSINNSPGLLDFLYGNSAYCDIFYKSKRENLKLIPCGKQYVCMPSPFTRAAFSNFMVDVKCLYDIIFIDTEASIDSAYTQSLLPYADGVILVVEQGKTRIEDVNKVFIQLKNYNVCFIGSCMNRCRKFYFK